MSYEFYKILHLFSLVVIVMCLAANTLLPKPQKWSRISGMVASLFLIVAGMGLIARTSSHSAAWPTWVIVKIVIWALLAIGGPILIKRLPQFRPHILAGAITLIMLAVSLAIIKPTFI